MQLVSADRRWTGRRCFVAASGPSLDESVFVALQGELVIAVNDAYRLLPHAAVLYACDAAWWEHHKGVPNFTGERWTSHSLAPKNDKRHIAGKYQLHVITGSDRGGAFSRDPAVIHYGSNSGFQAVNLAILFGADPIVLVGFDMREIEGRRHFFGNHKSPLRDEAQYRVWIEKFTQAAKASESGPHIINATPGSALGCFPRVSLAELTAGQVGPVAAGTAVAAGSAAAALAAAGPAAALAGSGC